MESNGRWRTNDVVSAEGAPNLRPSDRRWNRTLAGVSLETRHRDRAQGRAGLILGQRRCRFHLPISNAETSYARWTWAIERARIFANDFTGRALCPIHCKPERPPSAASPPSDEAWLTARRIARELDRILDTAGSHRAAVERAAAELRLSTRQVYYLLARYRADRRVSSLLPRRSGARKKQLYPDVEVIIAATLRTQWLTLEAPPLAPVVAEIRARCEETGLSAPSYLAVARRIPALFGPEEIARSGRPTRNIC